MVRRADSKLIFAKHGEVPIATNVHRNKVMAPSAPAKPIVAKNTSSRDYKLPRHFIGSSQ